MTELRDVLSESQSLTEMAPRTLTSDERWARWQEKGARHDARVDRNMRLIASIGAIALTIGAVWALLSPR